MFQSIFSQEKTQELKVQVITLYAPIPAETTGYYTVITLNKDDCTKDSMYTGQLTKSKYDGQGQLKTFKEVLTGTFKDSVFISGTYVSRQILIPVIYTGNFVLNKDNTYVLTDDNSKIEDQRYRSTFVGPVLNNIPNLSVGKLTYNLDEDYIKLLDISRDCSEILSSIQELYKIQARITEEETDIKYKFGPGILQGNSYLNGVCYYDGSTFSTDPKESKTFIIAGIFNNNNFIKGIIKTNTRTYIGSFKPFVLNQTNINLDYVLSNLSNLEKEELIVIKDDIKKTTYIGPLTNSIITNNNLSITLPYEYTQEILDKLTQEEIKLQTDNLESFVTKDNTRVLIGKNYSVKGTGFYKIVYEDKENPKLSNVKLGFYVDGHVHGPYIIKKNNGYTAVGIYNKNIFVKGTIFSSESNKTFTGTFNNLSDKSQVLLHGLNCKLEHHTFNLIIEGKFENNEPVFDECNFTLTKPTEVWFDDSYKAICQPTKNNNQEYNITFDKEHTELNQLFFTKFRIHKNKIYVSTIKSIIFRNLDVITSTNLDKNNIQVCVYDDREKGISDIRDARYVNITNHLMNPTKLQPLQLKLYLMTVLKNMPFKFYTELTKNNISQVVLEQLILSNLLDKENKVMSSYGLDAAKIIEVREAIKN
jgi:hypothetical protein